MKFGRWFYERSIKSMRKKAKLISDTIEVEGYKISYLKSIIEDRKSLIFIHGCDGSKDDWLILAKHLEHRYNLIMIDFLGCGDSSKVLEFDYSLTSQALLLEKIIEQITIHLGISQYSLCGISSGSSLSILLADKLPVEKLIILNSLGFHKKDSKIDLLAKKAGSIENLPWLNINSKKDIKEMMKISFYKAPYMPSFMQNYFLEKLISHRELSKHKFSFFYDKDMNLRDDLSKYTKGIKQESLIIWGENDNNIDISSAYLLKKLIKNSTLKVYKECGHLITIETPKEIGKDIIEFLG